MSRCAFPKDLVQGLEVSLEYEFGDDTSRRSTVQIRNAHLGLAKHGQVVMFAPFFFQRTSDLRNAAADIAKQRRRWVSSQ